MTGVIVQVDWRRILTEARIDFVERGGGITEGHIGVNCPYCHDDPSYHLSISLEGKGWRCLRNDRHKGRSPIRLVQGLFHCGYDKAAFVCGLDRLRPSEDILAKVTELLGDKSKHEKRELLLELPSEFCEFKENSMSAPFLSYMERRGFPLSQLMSLADRLGIRYAKFGPYRGRIIFPVTKEYKLFTWTGRSILSSDDIRYLSHPVDEIRAGHMGLPPALESISNCLLWYDECRNAGIRLTLVICEGPMDALKIWLHGSWRGIFGVCLFRMDASSEQLSMLNHLRTKYKRTVLLLDKGTLAASIKISRALPRVDVMILPDGVKDPGELNERQFEALKL